jgi:hypothetical protein
MASLTRSKSCSFIPQDLPISELFSEIKVNREKIQRIEYQFVKFTENFLSDFRSLESAIAAEIKSIKGRISLYEKDITELRRSLNAMERHVMLKTKDIQIITCALQELTVKVELLAKSRLV